MFKWLYYPKPSIGSKQSLSKFQKQTPKKKKVVRQQGGNLLPCTHQGGNYSNAPNLKMFYCIKEAGPPSTCQAAKLDHCWAKQAGQGRCGGKHLRVEPPAREREHVELASVSTQLVYLMEDCGSVIHLPFLLWRELHPIPTPLAHFPLLVPSFKLKASVLYLTEDQRSMPVPYK